MIFQTIRNALFQKEFISPILFIQSSSSICRLLINNQVRYCKVVILIVYQKNKVEYVQCFIIYNHKRIIKLDFSLKS